MFSLVRALGLGSCYYY